MSHHQSEDKKHLFWSTGAEYWRDRRIIVTGGAGFLGAAVVRALQCQGASNIYIPRSRKYDLRDTAAIRRLLDDTRPNIIIHLAANVGGIGANREHPAEFFYDNLMMGVQLLHNRGVLVLKNSWRLAPSVRTRNIRRCRSAKTTCGMATRKKPMRLMAWPRK